MIEKGLLLREVLVFRFSPLRKVVENDCEVLCVDNLYSGSKENISHLLLNSNFEFIRHDITFPLYLEADEIFNLACPASPFIIKEIRLKPLRPVFMVVLIC